MIEEKKSLNIPKGLSKSVNRSKDNTIGFSLSILTQKNKTDWMAAGLACIYSLLIEGNIISYNEINHTTYFTVSYSLMLEASYRLKGNNSKRNNCILSNELHLLHKMCVFLFINVRFHYNV